MTLPENESESIRVSVDLPADGRGYTIRNIGGGRISVFIGGEHTVDLIATGDIVVSPPDPETGGARRLSPSVLGFPVVENSDLIAPDITLGQWRVTTGAYTCAECGCMNSCCCPTLRE